MVPSLYVLPGDYGVVLQSIVHGPKSSLESCLSAEPYCELSVALRVMRQVLYRIRGNLRRCVQRRLMQEGNV